MKVTGVHILYQEHLHPAPLHACLLLHYSIPAVVLYAHYDPLWILYAHTFGRPNQSRSLTKQL